MKFPKRAAAFVLALMLSLSVVLPALAAARDISKNLATSVVLVSCKMGGETRKGTGIVVGKMSEPQNSAIVVDPWVIFNQDSAMVEVTVRGKRYDELCVNYEGSLGVILPVNAYGSIAPIAMVAASSMPVGTPIEQAYNNGANKVLAHSGAYIGYEEDEAFIGQFANDDLNRIQPEPWKSLGTAIVTELNGRYLLMGMAKSVVPSSNAIYFRDCVDIVLALMAFGVSFDSEGEIAVKPDEDEEITVYVDYAMTQLQARDAAISQEQLTQTIILVVAGIVIVAAIVVMVLVLLRRKNGAGGKAAFTLVGMTGVLSGMEFPVRGEMTIGRSGTCDVKFDKNTPGISAEHCLVSVKGGKLYVMDKGSSYGTMDKRGNKLPAHQPVELQRGESFFLATKDNGFMVK